MLEKLELNGMWWIPEAPKDKIPGVLHFSQEEGLHLDLMGHLPFNVDYDAEHLISVFQTHYDIIFGEILHGKDVTLVGCLQTGMRGTPKRKHITSSLRAKYLLVGTHFTTSDAIRFNEIGVRYSYFDQWVNAQAIRVESPVDSHTIMVNYTMPEPILAAQWENCIVTISFDYNVSPFGTSATEVTLKQDAWIRFEFSVPASWEDSQMAIRKVQQFLSLAVTEPVYPIEIEAVVQTQRETVEVDEEEIEINIYYQLARYPQKQKELSVHQMMFTLGEHFENLPPILEAFLKNESLLKPVYDLYFAMLYSPDIYAEPRFLSLAQAIEVYHRRTLNNEELPLTEHEMRLEAILNSAPEMLRKWLQGKLQFSNEPTLKKRLKSILYDERFSDLVATFIPDKKGFIYRVVCTRNYYTHYSKELEKCAAHDAALYPLTERIKLLLEIIFLTELGFTKSDLEALTALKRANLPRPIS